MQLSYRGNHYTYEPASVDMVDSGVVGVYRGQTFPITYPRHIPVPQSVHTLTYRGASYRTTATGGIAPVTQPQEQKRSVAQSAPVQPTYIQRSKPVSVPSNLRWSSNVQSIEYDKVHRSNIQRRLQQRIEAAKARGDLKLLNLLEHEMQQAG